MCRATQASLSSQGRGALFFVTTDEMIRNRVHGSKAYERQRTIPSWEAPCALHFRETVRDGALACLVAILSQCTRHGVELKSLRTMRLCDLDHMVLLRDVAVPVDPSDWTVVSTNHVYSKCAVF
jgi:hypothetical protein